MTVAITRTDYTAADLRRQAAGSADAAVVRRLLGLALVLDGRKRADAARLAGMDRQTLRDWVHRYNADGVAGLSDRHGGGVAARLSNEQEAQVAGWMRAGPDVVRDRVVRWRRVDIQARIATHFSVALHERSVGKLLDRLGFSHISTRPRHPKADVRVRYGTATEIPFLHSHLVKSSNRLTLTFVRLSDFYGETTTLVFFGVTRSSKSTFPQHHTVG